MGAGCGKSAGSSDTAARDDSCEPTAQREVATKDGSGSDSAQVNPRLGEPPNGDSEYPISPKTPHNAPSRAKSLHIVVGAAEEQAEGGHWEDSMDDSPKDGSNKKLSHPLNEPQPPQQRGALNVGGPAHHDSVPKVIQPKPLNPGAVVEVDTSSSTLSVASGMDGMTSPLTRSDSSMMA